jgi:Amt family ammonium transporter
MRFSALVAVLVVGVLLGAPSVHAKKHAQRARHVVSSVRSEVPQFDGLYAKVSIQNEQAETQTKPEKRQILFPITQEMWEGLLNDIDTFFVLTMGTLVFLMQLGFVLLEAGMVRSKNIVNLLFKNIMDVCIGCVGWYLFGYAFFAGSGNSFIGHDHFALQDVGEPGESGTFVLWFYSFTFAATSSTIASGCMAERTQLVGYLIFTFVCVSFTYPVVAHWLWSDDGWLGIYSGDPPIASFGCLDFAGGLVVHLVGGLHGIVGTLALGPRLGRFDNDGPKPQGHNIVLVAEGTFVLWFGWYGFNSGSTYQVTQGISEVAALAAVNSTLSASFGGIVGLAFSTIVDKRMDLGATMNGILAGLVAITSPCVYIEPWAAVIIGMVAGVAYQLAARALIAVKIDDPIDAFPVHAVNGIWSAISVGLFANTDRVLAIHPFIANSSNTYDHGLFLGGGGRQLAAQIVGIVVVSAWSLCLASLCFLPVKFLGLLRVPVMEERMGLDEAKHGGHAYPEHSLIMRTLATRLLSKDQD